MSLLVLDAYDIAIHAKCSVLSFYKYISPEV